VDEDVLELPGVFEVEVLIGQLVAPVFEGVPVSVVPTHWSDVGFLDLQAPPVIHLVAFHQPCLGVFQGPSHAGNHS